jgi:hypothetical protein
MQNIFNALNEINSLKAKLTNDISESHKAALLKKLNELSAEVAALITKLQ